MTFAKPSFFLTAVFGALFAAAIAKAAETEDRKKLVEMAQKEGNVVFYTSMDAADARSLTETFQKRYPFIKPDFYRAGREAVFSRFALEQKAGRYVTDVVSVGGFHMLEMKKQGLTTWRPGSRVGAEFAVTAGGLIILLIVMVLMVGFPHVRKYRISQSGS